MFHSHLFLLPTPFHPIPFLLPHTPRKNLVQWMRFAQCFLKFFFPPFLHSRFERFLWKTNRNWPRVISRLTLHWWISLLLPLSADLQQVSANEAASPPLFLSSVFMSLSLLHIYLSQGKAWHYQAVSGLICYDLIMNHNLRHCFDLPDIYDGASVSFQRCQPFFCCLAN